jgi:hypothetical protein
VLRPWSSLLLSLSSAAASNRLIAHARLMRQAIVPLAPGCCGVRLTTNSRPLRSGLAPDNSRHRGQLMPFGRSQRISHPPAISAERSLTFPRVGGHGLRPTRPLRVRDVASIRKRQWKTATGEQQQAWIADFFDQGRVRRLKTFPTKKAATDWLTTAQHQVTAGSASITLAAAADLKREQGEGAVTRPPRCTEAEGRKAPFPCRAMSHGFAGGICKSLELLVFFCDTLRHEIGRYSGPTY